MTTIKELKQLIKDLPDSMEIQWVDPRDGSLTNGSMYVMTKKDMTEEELNDGYPDGFLDYLVINPD